MRQVAAPNRSPSRRGFSLVELMVVVGLIIVLMALALPAMTHFKRAGTVAACKTLMSSLQQGLQTYYNDFSMYPASSPYIQGTSTLVYPTGPAAGRGSAMLAEGLMGYLPFDVDGAGPKLAGGSPSAMPTDPLLGFRVRKNAATMGGKVYGPYGPDDPKGYKDFSNGAAAATDQAFVDPWGNEILYYRSRRTTQNIHFPDTPSMTAVPVKNIFDTATNLDASASTDNAYFNSDDCSVTKAPPSPPASSPDPRTGSPAFFALFTDGPSVSYTGGPVKGSDSYLLISAGPNTTYFDSDDIVVGKP